MFPGRERPKLSRGPRSAGSGVSGWGGRSLSRAGLVYSALRVSSPAPSHRAPARNASHTPPPRGRATRQKPGFPRKRLSRNLLIIVRGRTKGTMAPEAPGSSGGTRARSREVTSFVGGGGGGGEANFIISTQDKLHRQWRGSACFFMPSLLFSHGDDRATHVAILTIFADIPFLFSLTDQTNN